MHIEFGKKIREVPGRVGEILSIPETTVRWPLIALGAGSSLIAACAPQPVEISFNSLEPTQATLEVGIIAQESHLLPPEDTASFVQKISGQLRDITKPINAPLIEKIESIGQDPNPKLVITSSEGKIQVTQVESTSEPKQILSFRSQGDSREGVATAEIKSTIDLKGQLGSQPSRPLSEEGIQQAIQAGIRVPEKPDKPLKIDVGGQLVAMQVRFGAKMVQVSSTGEITIQSAEPLPFRSRP